VVMRLPSNKLVFHATEPGQRCGLELSTPRSDGRLPYLLINDHAGPANYPARLNIRPSEAARSTAATPRELRNLNWSILQSVRWPLTGHRPAHPRRHPPRQAWNRQRTVPL